MRRRIREIVKQVKCYCFYDDIIHLGSLLTLLFVLVWKYPAWKENLVLWQFYKFHYRDFWNDWFSSCDVCNGVVQMIVDILSFNLFRHWVPDDENILFWVGKSFSLLVPLLFSPRIKILPCVGSSYPCTGTCHSHPCVGIDGSWFGQILESISWFKNVFSATKFLLFIPLGNSNSEHCLFCATLFPFQ